MRSCTVIRVNIDHPAGRIEGAAVKGHHRGGVRPERIIVTGSIEGRVLELGTGIAPVEGLAVDGAILHGGVVDADKAQIIRRSGLQRHVFERDAIAAVKGIITIIFRAEIRRIGNCRANAPMGLVRALPHESQALFR